MDTRQETITVTVDGREIACRPGELLIEVAKRAGIYIPFFCYHPRMDPVGACRMCLVHIEGGPPKPQTSCTTRVADGMVVQTQFANPDIKEAQEGVLEFLLLNHPLDCPICDRGGECPLQDQAQDYGPGESRFIEPKRRFAKPVPISPLIKLDRERCILCYRCTRFCEELSGDTLIGVMERGPSSYIYPFEGEDFSSIFSGNTVQICPVGALTSTPYRFRARPWDLHNTTTTCNLCAAGCSLVASVRVQDGNLIRFSAATNEDTNEEWLCDKGRYGHAYISSPERLLQPMVRRGEELAPVSWDEAFGVLGERLGPLLGGGDRSRLGMLVGGSLCDEDTYAAQKFARVVGRTNSIDHRLEGGMSADALLPPQVGYPELLSADRVVLVSTDLREELPVVFLRLRIAATKRGTAVTVVHPRRIALTELAERHLAPLPGSDALVGAAVAAALGQPVAAGAEALAAAAGVPSAEVRALAEALRDAERPVILLGPRTVSDPQAVRAWRTVAAACGGRLGWTPRRAGEYGALAAGAHPDLLPGWRRVDDENDRRAVEELWGAPVPPEPGLDVGGMLERAAGGELGVLWLAGADLLNDVPDPALGGGALQGAGFVILQDVQQGPQLAHADLVLPAAAFVERQGTLTDWEGRRQSVEQASDPPGAARADYAIFAEAARRIGRPIGCRRLEDVRSELDSLARHDLPPGGVVDTVHAQIPQPDPERTLRLLAYRLLYDGGSRARHTPGIADLTPPVFVELHPDDARAAGIEDGASVRVSSAHGTIVAPARVDAATRRGVVFVPFAQPDGGARELLAWGDRSPDVSVERA